MWSTSRSIVAYYSDEVLSLKSPRDFKAMPGAKENRFRVGLSEDPARSKLGAHTIHRAFCACSSCFAPKFDFGNCRFQNLVGSSQRVWCPPAKPVGGALPAVMEVAEFAGTLKAGDVRAVNAAREEVHSEDAPFWLCVLLEENEFQATTPISIADEAFDEEFYLVKIQFLEFNDDDDDDESKQRRYRSNNDERMRNVNCLIRGEPIKLPKAKAPRSRTAPAPTPKQYYYLPKEERRRIIDSAEIQNFLFRSRLSASSNNKNTKLRPAQVLESGMVLFHITTSVYYTPDFL